MNHGFFIDLFCFLLYMLKQKWDEKSWGPDNF